MTQFCNRVLDFFSIMEIFQCFLVSNVHGETPAEAQRRGEGKGKHPLHMPAGVGENQE